MALAGLESTTGTRIYVAVGEPATYDAAGYGALDWEKVVGTTSFGEWGDQESDVNEPLLDEERVIHTAGIADGGTVQIGVQHRTTDAGSDDIKANAGASNTLMSVMKVYKSGEGEVATGIFMSPRYRAASGQSVRGYTTGFMVNSAVLELSAAEVTTALTGV